MYSAKTSKSTTKALAEAEVLSFIAGIPGLNTEHFAWDLGLEGFKDFMFGCRAGPEVGAEHLAHEVAHAVELEVHRRQFINAYGWGLKSPSIWVYDRFCVEPVTAQMAQRECRVAGIQKHLLEMSGLGVGEDFVGRSAHIFTTLLPDWYSGGSSEAKRKALRKRWILDSYEKHSPERISAILAEVIPYIGVQRQSHLIQLKTQELSLA